MQEDQPINPQVGPSPEPQSPPDVTTATSQVPTSAHSAVTPTMPGANSVTPPAEYNAQQSSSVQQPEALASAQSSEQKESPAKEGGFLSFAFTLIGAFILVQFINMFVFQSYKVFGSSMYPTLENGDRLIISKISRSVTKATNKAYIPNRADIIVFVDPLQPDMQLIKRVIGLPGERVVVHKGKITVYNQENPDGFNPDDADYGAKLPPTSGETDIVVPQGHLFVSGDNREGSNSLDSRNELGTVPQENIIGTLQVRIFPFNKAQFF